MSVVSSVLGTIGARGLGFTGRVAAGGGGNSELADSMGAAKEREAQQKAWDEFETALNWESKMEGAKKQLVDACTQNL